VTPVDWIWIPVTVWAAFAQTLRNLAQRHLTKELGTLGATLVRFLYGLPFAAAWLLGVKFFGGWRLPESNALFFLWVTFGAVSQIAATALLLRTMQERNFTLGVAYSKTELVQVAVFGLVVLGDPITSTAAFAVACGTVGVLMLSPADKTRPFASMLAGLGSRSALLGLASGAGFAFSVIGYRAAALSLGEVPFLMAAAYSLFVAQAIQTLLLGGWLLVRDAEVVLRVLRAWRASLFAGFMGAAASVGWFTAFTLTTGANVRTLGLIELVFAMLISRRLFKERLAPLEYGGIALLTLGLVVITLWR